MSDDNTVVKVAKEVSFVAVMAGYMYFLYKLVHPGKVKLVKR